jgi:hypothetical protein
MKDVTVTDSNDDLATRFEKDRTHLRGVAYRMLGSLSDADVSVDDREAHRLGDLRHRDALRELHRALCPCLRAANLLAVAANDDVRIEHLHERVEVRRLERRHERLDDGSLTRELALVDLGALHTATRPARELPGCGW